MENFIPRIQTQGYKKRDRLLKIYVCTIPPKGKRLYKMLKDEFGFSVVFKKTQTLGDILLKKGRSVEKQFRRNTICSIPCKE